MPAHGLSHRPWRPSHSLNRFSRPQSLLTAGRRRCLSLLPLFLAPAAVSRVPATFFTPSAWSHISCEHTTTVYCPSHRLFAFSRLISAQRRLNLVHFCCSPQRVGIVTVEHAKGWPIKIFKSALWWWIPSTYWTRPLACQQVEATEGEGEENKEGFRIW